MDHEPEEPSFHPVSARPTRVEPLATHTGSGVWHVVLWLLVLGALGAGGYFVYYRLHHADKAAGGGGGRRGNMSIPVVTATARRGDMDLYLNGLGSATPMNTVTVRTRVDGQIVKVYFQEGETVKADEPLFEIDPRPFQVQLDLAKGQMARDKALLENARRDLERYKSAKEAVTEQQISNQEATVAQLEGQLKSDQAQIDNAQLQLTYCHIISPISGRIGLRMVDLGNIVRANDQAGLAVITQVQPIAVVFSLSESQIPRVLEKMNASEPLEVEIFDRELTRRMASGRLTAIDSQIDPTTGTVRFKATFPNKDNMLFPNQFVNVRLLVETRKNVVIVPAAAIQRSPSSTFVYVVKADQTVEMRSVDPGPTQGDQTIVEKGLNPGELVVTEGVDKLVPGMKVIAGHGAASTRAATRGSSHSSTTRPAEARGGPGPARSRP